MLLVETPGWVGVRSFRRSWAKLLGQPFEFCADDHVWIVTLDLRDDDLERLINAVTGCCDRDDVKLGALPQVLMLYFRETFNFLSRSLTLRNTARLFLSERAAGKCRSTDRSPTAGIGLGAQEVTEL